MKTEHESGTGQILDIHQLIVSFIGSNKLTFIEPDMFLNLKNLLTLDLSFNYIEIIHSNMFQYLINKSI